MQPIGWTLSGNPVDSLKLNIIQVELSKYYLKINWIVKSPIQVQWLNFFSNTMHMIGFFNCLDVWTNDNLSFICKYTKRIWIFIQIFFGRIISTDFSKSQWILTIKYEGASCLISRLQDRYQYFIALKLTVLLGFLGYCFFKVVDNNI